MKHFIFFSAFALFTACTSAPKTDAAATETLSREAATPEAAPAGAAALQGKWQSLEDPKAEISIENTVYKDIYDGKEMSSGEFSYNADCADAACKEGKSPNGCFSIEDKKSQMTCFSIVNLTADALDCSLVGGTGKTNHYKKMQ
jgi:hypothetical protein